MMTGKTTCLQMKKYGNFDLKINIYRHGHMAMPVSPSEKTSSLVVTRLRDEHHIDLE
jgi:hypothetical protein